MFVRRIVCNLAVALVLISSVPTSFAYVLEPGSDGLIASDGNPTSVDSGNPQMATAGGDDTTASAGDGSTDSIMSTPDSTPDNTTDSSTDSTDGSAPAAAAETAPETDAVSSMQLQQESNVVDEKAYLTEAQNGAVGRSVYNSVYSASLAVGAGYAGGDITSIMASSAQKLMDQAKMSGVAEMFDDYALLANAAGVPDGIKYQAIVKLQLKRTITKMHTAAPVTIVCVGSSSTQGYPGYGAADPSQTYPSQLQAKLQASYASSKITVINRGIGGTTASTMITNFTSSVFNQNPDLVIWQTGTVEALNHEDYNLYLNLLKSGTQTLANYGYDVAMLDSQYYPGFGETDQYRKFVAAMDVVGKPLNIPVFHRYDYMKQLVQSGSYSWGSLLYTDQFHPSALMHQLTAQYIADLLK